jgi:hypothetical protein
MLINQDRIAVGIDEGAARGGRHSFSSGFLDERKPFGFQAPLDLPYVGERGEILRIAVPTPGLNVRMFFSNIPSNNPMT